MVTRTLVYVVGFLVSISSFQLCFAGYFHELAKQAKYEELLKGLELEKYASIDAQDEDGNTVLHIIARQGNTGLYSVLSQNGANEDLANNDGLTPFKLIQLPVTPSMPAPMKTPSVAERKSRSVPECSALQTPRKPSKMKKKDEQLFQDHEIIKKIAGHTLSESSIVRHERVNLSVYENQGLHIIQQKAHKGCSAAVLTMKLLDLKRNAAPGINFMSQCNGYYSAEHLEKKFINEGLHTQIELITRDSKNGEQILTSFSKLLAERGPVLLTITDPVLAGHWIILDSISSQGVQNRDPYHGWMILVGNESFLKRLSLETPEKALWVWN